MAGEIFTALEETRVKELFDAVDSNHDGLITAPELIHVCAQFGHELSADKAAVNKPSSLLYVLVGYYHISWYYFTTFQKGTIGEERQKI